MRKSIPKSLKNLLWDKTYGKEQGTGLCQVCKQRVIDSKHFHVAHILPVSQGGTNDISNLKCSCAICNLSMGIEHLNLHTSQYFPRSTCYVCQQPCKENYMECCNIYCHDRCFKDYLYHVTTTKGRYYTFIRDVDCIKCYETCLKK